MKENWKKCIEQAKESNHTWLHKAAVSAKCLSSHLNGNWQRQWIQCWNYEIAWGGTKGRNALWNMCSFKSACNGTNILLTNNYQSILIHSIPANLVLFSLKFPATKRKKAAPESRNVLVSSNLRQNSKRIHLCQSEAGNVCLHCRANTHEIRLRLWLRVATITRTA